MKRCAAIFIFLLYSSSLISEDYNRTKIDSLKYAIASSAEDSVKVKLYDSICDEFYYHNNDSILHYAAKIADIANLKGNKHFQAISDAQYGTAYWEKSQYDDAIFHYERALQYRKSKSGFLQDSLAADVSYNLGICYTDMANFDKALEMLTVALEYFEKTSDYQWKAHSFTAIGDIYIKLENYKKAVDNYRLALATLPENLYGQFDQGLFYSNLANGLYQTNLLDSARHYVLKSKLIFEKEKMDWGLAFCYAILSKIDIEEKQYESAKRNARSSLKYSTQQGTPSEMAEAHLLIGEACLMNNEIEGSLENVNKGAEISESSNLLTISVKAKKLLSSIYEKLGDTKSSYMYYKDYITLKDSLLSLDKIEEINQINLEIETAKRDAEIANQNLEIAKQKLTRDYLIGGIGGITFLSFIILGRIRYKQRINEAKLQLKQEKIENLEQRQKLMAVDYIIKGQEEERRRVAVDLHDSLGGMLSTAKHQLRTLSKSINPSEVDKLNQTEELISSAHEEVRKIAHNMMPDAIINLGLKAAIEDLANHVNLTDKLEVKTQIAISETSLNKDQDLIVYRIIQESINNAFKHANAKQLLIQMIDQKDAVHLTIEDDGVGFNMQNGHRSKGLGLKSMESRVKYLNGQIEIASKVGEGTTIDIIIPLSKK